MQREKQYSITLTNALMIALIYNDSKLGFPSNEWRIRITDPLFSNRPDTPIMHTAFYDITILCEQCTTTRTFYYDEVDNFFELRLYI